MQQATNPDPRGSIIGRNIMTFGRRLRTAGLKVGTGKIIELFDALSVVEITRMDDVYAASRAVLVNRPDQVPAFDAEFARFWQDLISRMPAMIDSRPHQENASQRPDDQKQEKGEKTRESEGEDGEIEEKATLAVTGSEDLDDAADTDDFEAPPEDVLVFSASEALRKKDFSRFTPEEMARARRLMERMNWTLGTRKTRRREKARRGEFIDQRSMLRDSMRHGGMAMELKFRRRKEKMRPLVLICDISGSMDRYSRMLLQFVHTLETGLENVEVFVFGTRLTRITRELRKRNVDRAIEDVVNAVDDWSGGTRIGEAIREFNYRWSRRVLRSNATVVMISDGWDRGDPFLHFAGDAAQLGELLVPGGRLASTLIMSADQLPLPNAQVLPVYANADAATLDRLAADIADGRLKTPIQQTYALDQIGDAFAAFTAGTRGKLAVAIS